MQIPEWLVGMDVQPKASRPSFATFIEAQTDLFVESMQDAAENQWHELQWLMNGASQEEIGAEMERWWNRLIRRFRLRLREEHRQDQERRLKRRLRAEVRRRHAAEERLESIEIELQQTRDSLTAEQTVTAFHKEQWRCRDCGRKSWDCDW